MRKPGDYSKWFYSRDDFIKLDSPRYVYFEEIPLIIKWLEKVQKYNEFKNKQKRKKVKNGK